MKDILKITAWCLAVLLLACLIAPPLWWAGQWAATSLGITYLGDQPFQRYFNRSVLIAAVILLIPAIRYLRLNHRNWNEFGLAKNPVWLRDLAVGFGLAFVLLIAIGLVGWSLEVYRIQDNIRWDKIAKAPLTAAAVSLLEETLFRGVLLALVMRSAPVSVSVIFISALYSILHFLKPLNRELDEIHWFSAFEILPDSFHQFAEPWLVVGGFLTLFAIGLVLAYSRLRTASLWLPIGLHAGWIVGSRFFNVIWRQRDTMEPFYGRRIEIGIAPLLTVLVTGALVALYLRNRKAPNFS